MGDLKEMTYPEMLNRFRERRNESTVLLPLMSRLPEKCDLFHKAQSCLSIGPGPGEYDLAFIERCLPNLKKYVAVEIDKFCANELQKNIQNKFCNRVQSEVFDVDISKWDYLPSNGDSAQFDVILVSHMLYDFNSHDCQSVLSKCLNKWLTPKTGVLVIIHMSDLVNGEGKTVNVMQNLHRYLSDYMPLLREAKDIQMMLDECGAEILFKEKYSCNMDFSKFDLDVVKLFNIYTDKTIDVPLMKKALQSVIPEGIGTYVAELMLARKKL